MMRLGLSILFISALTANACGSSSGKSNSDAGNPDAAGDVSTGVKVTVSGVAAPHPLTAPVGMNPASDFSMINVAVVDPATVIASPTAPPLAGGPLDTSAANCPTTGCAWSFANVDISGITLGLVGILDDARTTGRLWVKTGTGSGGADFINGIKADPQPITMRQLFAVSEATEAALATFAGAVLLDAALVPGVLETRGFMLGTVIGKLSAGASPVAGATVTPSGTTATKVDILYPNETFSGNGTSTASHGTFLVVPKLATPPSSIVASWTVTPPAADTRVWPVLTAGTNPGTAFVLLFPANE
jgi:hypothetical protein